MRILVLLLCLVCLAAGAQGSVSLAARGRALCPILLQPGATAPERYAAEELARYLGRITGAEFEVRQVDGAVPESAIVVGQGPVADRLFPDAGLAAMGREQLTMRTRPGYLLLAGGRPRGTLYAVYRFLQTRCGVRWWAPWAERVPSKAALTVPELSVTEQPAFESRDPFWFPAFNGDWAARNYSNSQSASLDEKHGGKVLYKGFVHTFYPLVPPEKYFEQHPEWYSLINGKRTHENAQLCTTNPALRDFMVQRVREWLRESPESSIISVSQNDCHGACQCPECRAIDEREGSPSGSMLALVNYIAERIEPEFPHVAVDTLAYQYTRKAPRTIKPRPNVIVRLCSIECNFAAPLEDPSNRAFAQDIRDWSRLSDRLYIWDYTTNFAHYVLPHPNWFALGPNVRFFQEHGVKGLFEQGAYQSFGSEMSELRAWLLAQLLWDPHQDDRKLIDEFLDGYYGKASARYIRQYMALLAREAKGYYMTCYSSPGAPFLRFATLSKAERLWEQAEEAAGPRADLRWRVRQGRLPVWYTWLVRWSPLRRECLKAGAEWPVPSSRKALASTWLEVATGPGPEGWAPMTRVNEGGLTPQALVAGFAEDPPEPVVAALPERLAKAAPPAGVPGAGARGCVDAQDDLARLWNEGDDSELRGDPAASDGLAIWMPGSHHEWAAQFPASSMPAAARSGRWRVYAVVRVDRAPDAPDSAPAFTAGVYDAEANAGRAQISATVEQAGGGYRAYDLGAVEMTPGCYVWLAPPANPAVRAVWVDRVYLVPER
ncbi:MAG: DUF4838 domain-containing protein [Chthonomonadales bacterium]|nr:DUF4838 domain-containing protein [Chthonomonadales bacterium]